MANQQQANMVYDDELRHNINWTRPLCGALCTIFIIFLLFSSITWAILQPHAPRFVLEDTTIYSFNLSTRNGIFSPTLQVRIWYHNPNRRIEIFYYNLKVYATYYGHQITYSADFPPLYQGHNDTNVLSPTLFGNNNLLVSRYIAPHLLHDQDNGAFWITVKIFGRVFFRVGAFVSEHYHLHIDCPAYIPFPNSSAPNREIVTKMAAAAVKYPLSRSCAVSLKL